MPVDAALLEQMVRAIVDEVDPDRVILFGSHARRDARPDSDVDLIVVEREPFGPDRSRFVEMNRLYDTLSHFFVPKDILVFNRDEVERWRNSINHVLARSLREGVVLYERPRICPRSEGGHSLLPSRDGIPTVGLSSGSASRRDPTCHTSSTLR